MHEQTGTYETFEVSSVAITGLGSLDRSKSASFNADKVRKAFISGKKKDKNEKAGRKLRKEYGLGKGRRFRLSIPISILSLPPQTELTGTVKLENATITGAYIATFPGVDAAPPEKVSGEVSYLIFGQAPRWEEDYVVIFRMRRSFANEVQMKGALI